MSFLCNGYRNMSITCTVSNGNASLSTQDATTSAAYSKVQKSTIIKAINNCFEYRTCKEINEGWCNLWYNTANPWKDAIKWGGCRLPF